MKKPDNPPPLRRGQLPARFDHETQFELTPRFDSFRPVSVHQDFEQLKARLLKPVLRSAQNPTVRQQLRLAANEAAAVAWTTPFPLLVLPVLLEEKAEEVHDHARRQAQVEENSQLLACPR